MNCCDIVELATDNVNQNKILVYKRRYLVLFVLAASLFCNAEAWMTFGSVSSKAEVYYNKSTGDIDLFGSIFLITYALVALPCTFMPKLIGLKWTLVSGSCFNFLGALLRLTSLLISDDHIQNNFIIAMTGNVIFGVAMGFLVSTPTLVSSVWFSDKDRSISTAIPYMSDALGVGVGFLDIFLVMGNKREAYDIKYSFLYIAIAEITVNFTICLCSFLMVSERPPTPPSRSELERSRFCAQTDSLTNIKNILKIMKEILCNIHAVIALIIFSFNYGCYAVIFLFLSTVIDIFSQSKTNISGYIGAGGVILGGIMTLVFGFIMKKTGHLYARQIGISVNLLCAVPLVIVFILISQKRLENISSSTLFVFYLAFAPVYISVGSEILADITYPADANISSSLALITGTLFGGLLSRLLRINSTDLKYRIAFGVCIGLYFINSILFLIPLNQNKSKAAEN